MILLDPELEPDSSPHGSGATGGSAGSLRKSKAASPDVAANRSSVPWPDRLPTQRTLTRFLARAQAAVKLRGQVSVLLTTDEGIRGLNRRFRGKNKPTDVLSFPAASLQNTKPTERIAGDLAISVPTARRQAAEHGHALTCELEILILHGLLHLAGYDHENDTGQMHSREHKLRAEIGLPMGLIERAASSGARVRRTDGANSPSTRSLKR
ncbi:MAG TPA: rRNA maturation RNase YbeY [Terriglobales bacterium]|jgi:probable rRNA maturation factor